VTAATKTEKKTVAAATATAAKKPQSTKSCSEKRGNDGSGRGVSDGGDGFDVRSGNDDRQWQQQWQWQWGWLQK
jgi:hypothetical protein